MAKKTKSFEDKLLELEEIVETMQDKSTLQDISSQYEKAQELLTSLKQELETSKQKFFKVENNEIKEQ
ncbi:MAG: exodeoxyribonuclease VII small subunit [Eubacteriales bacterium]|nr:exodeoxyribonuclease VII small subunit [Eubacteriales bacterium]